MIDPFEALIALALNDTGLAGQVEGRIAVQHRYGQDAGAPDEGVPGDWPLGAKSLIFSPTAANPQLYVQVQRVRAACRCYGMTPVDCMDVFRALVDMTRFNGKRVVNTSEGRALVYWANLLTQPQLIVDDELVWEMPYFSVVLEAEIAEEAVP